MRTPATMTTASAPTATHGTRLCHAYVERRARCGFAERGVTVWTAGA